MNNLSKTQKLLIIGQLGYVESLSQIPKEDKHDLYGQTMDKIDKLSVIIKRIGDTTLLDREEPETKSEDKEV